MDLITTETALFPLIKPLLYTCPKTTTKEKHARRETMWHVRSSYHNRMLVVQQPTFSSLSAVVAFEMPVEIFACPDRRKLINWHTNLKQIGLFQRVLGSRSERQKTAHQHWEIGTSYFKHCAVLVAVNALNVCIGIVSFPIKDIIKGVCFDKNKL